MASVQELLLAAETKKSPFIKLLEGAAQGFGQAQQGGLDRTIKMIQLDQMRQEMAQQAEMQKEIQMQLSAQQESATQRGLKSVAGAPAAVLPTQKLKQKISQDEKGRYSRSFEMVEPKEPASLDAIVAGKVDRGEMTLEQAYALKNRSEGISPSLNYQMQKDAEKRVTEEKGRVIPGYQSTGEVVVDDTEAKNLRSGVAEFETFKSGISEYKNLIKKYGTTEPTDRRAQGQLSAYAKNLQLRVKNLAQLGVLSASDIPFIEEQLPGPGVFRTKEGMLGALDTAEKLMTTSINKKLKTSGYVATEQTPPLNNSDLSSMTDEELKRIANGEQ